MREAYSKKSDIPVKTTLLFTLVLGLVTSISCFNTGIVSKNFLILIKASCGRPSRNSLNSFLVLSFAGYILSPSKT